MLRTGPLRYKKKPLATQGSLCLSVSPLHTAGLQGVVSVEVASLSLHKKGDLFF